jgi:hypothetical protein
MLQDFTKIPFDVVILSGQSNAEGCGFGSVDAPYAPNKRVMYMNRDDTISLAVERVERNAAQTNFGLSFAREYLAAGRLAEGRSLLILRAAAGGTGFLSGHWGTTDALFLQMMEMIRTALALNPENRLVAMLWHQGENDVNRGATYEGHYQNLSTLITTVRDTFHVPKLPFLAGDFTPLWREEKGEACAPVSDAVRAVCRDVGYADFVETDGLASNFETVAEHPLGWPHDSIHFSREALYLLGKRYFSAFAAIAD